MRIHGRANGSTMLREAQLDAGALTDSQAIQLPDICGLQKNGKRCMKRIEGLEICFAPLPDREEYTARRRSRIQQTRIFVLYLKLYL